MNRHEERKRFPLELRLAGSPTEPKRKTKMTNQHLDPVLEEHAKVLQHEPGYTVLRRVPEPYSQFPDDGVPPDGRCIAIVDLETTGLDAEKDSIIELALMLVWVDEEGEIISHFGPLSWLEDPGVELDPRITLVTGLANHHLVGKTINDISVEGLLSRADMFVAHNAQFEIDFLERRYRILEHAPWGCSLRDIDWLMAGFDARAQGHLLMQHSWFSDAHRAGPDVWSLFWLMSQRRKGLGADPERTHLQRLLEAIEKDSVVVQANRAPFSKKDLLKARGYRWNADARFWQKELGEELVAHEQAWFYCQGLPAPTLRPISAHQRHR